MAIRDGDGRIDLWLYDWVGIGTELGAFGSGGGKCTAAGLVAGHFMVTVIRRTRGNLIS